jgi:hypothetical protein
MEGIMPERDTSLGSDIEEPIVVPASATSQMVTTCVRYLLVALAGWLASKGLSALLGIDLTELLTSDQTVNAIAGLVVTGIVASLGALKSRKNVAVQQTLADKLPNRVARVE